MSDTARAQAAAAQVGPWSKLYGLTIEFADDGNPANGRIYKNGYQQIGVLLSVKPTDADDHPLTESNSPGITGQVERALGLVNYADAKRLQFVHSGAPASLWCYTDTPNEFTTGSSMNAFLFSTDAEDDVDDDTLQFRFYIMCPPAEHTATIAIAAQVNVPNPGGSGTYSVTTRGVQPNDFPKQTLSIAAVPAVRYSDLNTDVKSLLAYKDADYSPSQKIQALNYLFTCREPGHDFIRFDIAADSVGEYWHVFDESSAYQDRDEPFKRYRKFSIAYAWSKASPAHEQVFGLKDQAGGKAYWWDVQVNHESNSLYFTVAEYDVTLGTGRGFGYPGSPVNVSSPANGGKANVYFTAWDQYGNSGDFSPETIGLLDGFKITPGRS